MWIAKGLVVYALVRILFELEVDYTTVTFWMVIALFWASNKITEIDLKEEKK